jgi:bacteriocin biosynthesis cyclodehydratase domain-containing protein
MDGLSMSRLPVRPCLAFAFTILTGPDRVRLVAGEDLRYTLTTPGLDTWLPGWLPALDGRRTLDELLALLPEDHREEARQVVVRLYGERVVTEAPAPAAHRPRPFRPQVEGKGQLADALRQAAGEGSDGVAEAVAVLAQDSLDFDEALRFNDRCLAGGGPWLWVTCGPQARGYVSPAFLADAGPCLACLLSHFQRLSPAPEIYADLLEHARRGLPITPSPFPAGGVEVLRDLLLWKVALLAETEPPAALFRLHVLEAATLEVSAHRVFIDPECAACRGGR